MNTKLAMCAALVVCLGVSFARGQNDPFDNDDDLRAQIKALEQKMQDRKKSERSNDRVTEIGGSRMKMHEPQDEQLVVRIYELNDLFAVAPAYYAQQPDDLGDTGRSMFANIAGHSSGGGMGGIGGGGFFAVPEVPRSIANVQGPLMQLGGAAPGGNLNAARTSLDDLMTAITNTISPQEWKQSGGRGSISRLGNNLLISATEKTHEQIDVLLGLFRKRWGSLRTVSLRAYWLWLTPDQLTTALADDRPAPAPGAGLSGAAFGVVADAAWTKLLQQAQADKERPGYRAAVTCYNGQTVSVVSGGQRRFVGDVSPSQVGTTKEGEPIMAFTPTVKSVHDGAALQFTSLTTTTGKFVVLDIQTRVNRVQPGGDAKPALKGRMDQSASIEQLVAVIERPAIASYQMATTLRVPVDRPMLVGGMTFSGEPQGNEADLYLFVQVAVQELRDDLPADKAGDKPGEKAVEKPLDKAAASAIPLPDAASPPPPPTNPAPKTKSK